MKPSGGEPCNSCTSCREITLGNAFDVVEMDAATHRKIEAIRDLRQTIMMPPLIGAYKVYILDEVHMLTVEAENALLKMLEEPPAHVIFLLATTDMQKLLPTVLSRCQRFDFKPIPMALMVDRLQVIAKREQVVLEEGAAVLMARAASGDAGCSESPGSGYCLRGEVRNA